MIVRRSFRRRMIGWMEKRTVDFKVPPVVDKPDGSSRRVGFELEFSGISLEEAADALKSSLGGEVHSKSAAECRVGVDPLGEFNIELDWDFLKRKAAETAETEEAAKWVERLSEAAALLVPLEVVCPPIPITDLASLHPMVAALREAGAVGTEESPIAAYGVHINSEIPDLNASTLSCYLKAFVLLQWWLVDAHQVNTARKLSPYVDFYSDAYVIQVLSRRKPDLDELFADYLEHNADRNRALDLLPMLAAVDETRVRQAIDDPRIKARPAFHYRLPNCQIERPDWSLAGPWNTWCVVENVADRPDDLNELSDAFLAAERPLLGVSRNDWVAFVDRWLEDHALA